MDIIPLIIVSICQRTPTLRSVFEKICFSKLDYGVMVTRQILVLKFQVRVLIVQLNNFGKV